MDGAVSHQLDQWVAAQNERSADRTAVEVIAAARDMFGDRFALVSSFGAESAVLLHLAAQVDPGLPILFLDTGKLFGETKRYRDDLLDRLGMSNLIIAKPDADDLALHDAKGMLFSSQPNQCCFIRKVKPLDAQLADYDAWATGRKRFQSRSRETLEHFEMQDGKVKVNPLALWESADVSAYMDRHDLPRNPLVAEGFRSIGCMPCTDRVSDGEDERAGRWRGSAKTECGIHLSLRENAELASFEGSGL